MLRFNFYRPTPPKKGGFCVRENKWGFNWGLLGWIQKRQLILRVPEFVNNWSAQADFTTDLTLLYKQYPWHDLWSDAGIVESLQYVRGSKKLRLPQEWRAVLPDHLPVDSETDSD